MRHAEADPDGPSDHQRPLDPRGIRSVPGIGTALVERGWVPQVVVSSDARRTRETWLYLSEVLGGSPEVRFTAAFYLAGPPEVRTELRSLPADVGTAIVIGHNPGWEEVVYQLCGVRVHMSPASAVLLAVEADDWAQALARGRWRLQDVLRPSR